MRHKIKGRKLNRTSSHKKAMFSNMVNSLVEHEQITTTLPKAKDLRTYIDKMITFGKKGDLTSRRKAIAFMKNEEMVRKIFDVLAPRYKERNGGYTRVLKAGFRYGDCAPMAVVELMERDETAKGKAQKEALKAAKEAEAKKQAETSKEAPKAEKKEAKAPKTVTHKDEKKIEMSAKEKAVSKTTKSKAPTAIRKTSASKGK